MINAIAAVAGYAIGLAFGMFVLWRVIAKPVIGKLRQKSGGQS